MDPKEQFQATTQRHITYLLIYGLMFLIIALLIGAYLPFAVNDKMLALAGPLVTGVYGLASGAVGFWIAKQRYQSAPDDDLIVQSHTSPDGTVTKVTAPASAPPASVPTLPNTTAPVAPLVQPNQEKSP